MRAALLTPKDAAWAELVARVPADIYHLPGYAAVCAQEAGGEPLLFAAREHDRLWLLPLIVRPVPASLADGQALCDAASPYGYSGPLVRSDQGGLDGWCACAIAALQASLEDRGVVTAFVRLHPLRPHPLAPLAEAGTLVHHGDTVQIDLTRSADELWRATRSRFRTDIQGLLRRGFIASMDEDCARLADFKEVYTRTMTRLGAAPGYFFSDAYYAGLRQGLEGRLRVCLVEHEGQLACAGLFTEMDGIVQYHLGGTHDDFLRFGPSKLMFHFVREWAKARGNAVLHLGGGHGGAADSLFRFKRGFAKDTVPFLTWRLVADQEAHARLIARWHELGGADREETEPTRGFFPAYRQPVPRPEAVGSTAG